MTFFVLALGFGLDDFDDQRIRRIDDERSPDRRELASLLWSTHGFSARNLQRHSEYRRNCCVSHQLYVETCSESSADEICFVRIFSLPFSAFVADKWGRRFGIFFGSCLMLCGVALQTAAQNIGMFIGARL